MVPRPSPSLRRRGRCPLRGGRTPSYRMCLPPVPPELRAVEEREGVAAGHPRLDRWWVLAFNDGTGTGTIKRRSMDLDENSATLSVFCGRPEASIQFDGVPPLLLSEGSAPDHRDTVRLAVEADEVPQGRVWFDMRWGYEINDRTGRLAELVRSGAGTLSLETPYWPADAHQRSPGAPVPVRSYLWLLTDSREALDRACG